MWGREDPGHTQAVSREQIEETLNKRNGAYQRLRRVMDAWAALWFWPLTDIGDAKPPTLEQWITACQALLGREPEARKNNRGMTPLGEATNWDDLNDAEDLNLDFAGAVNVDEVLRDTRGLSSANRSRSNRASSTGNSTSPRSSRAAASTCNWVIRHG